MSPKHLSQNQDADTDVQQVTEALAKIRDPMAKYFFAMFVELMAERISELVDANLGKTGSLSRVADLQRALSKTPPERAQHG